MNNINAAVSIVVIAMAVIALCAIVHSRNEIRLMRQEIEYRQRQVEALTAILSDRRLEINRRKSFWVAGPLHGAAGESSKKLNERFISGIDDLKGKASLE